MPYGWIQRILRGRTEMLQGAPGIGTPWPTVDQYGKPPLAGASLGGTGYGKGSTGVPWKVVSQGRPPVGMEVIRPTTPQAFHPRFGAGQIVPPAREHAAKTIGKTGPSSTPPSQSAGGLYEVLSNIRARIRGPQMEGIPGVGVPWKNTDAYGRPVTYQAPSGGGYGSGGTGVQWPVTSQGRPPVGQETIQTETLLPSGVPMPIRSGTVRRRVRNMAKIPDRAAAQRASPQVRAQIQAQQGLPKFTKDQVFYVDHSLYPTLSCINCKYFLPANAKFDVFQPWLFLNDKPRCAVVNESGGSGIINPEGTSTGFQASPARLKLIEKLYGRGDDQTGVLPQVIRKKLMPIGKAVLYPDLPTETLETVEPETLTQVTPAQVIEK